jgi:glycosyltransferase involved in cell wall biosynthesis
MPHLRLLVVGEGPGLNLVRAAANGAPNVTLRPPVPPLELVELMRRARAFVFAAEEDFGITMVEAQASGTPVIAFGRGGARDIVVDMDQERPTGILFGAQTVEAIERAVRRFDAGAHRITSAACRENATRFSTRLFHERMRSVVETAIKGRLR